MDPGQGQGRSLHLRFSDSLLVTESGVGGSFWGLDSSGALSCPLNTKTRKCYFIRSAIQTDRIQKLNPTGNEPVSLIRVYWVSRSIGQVLYPQGVKQLSPGIAL